MAHGANLYNEAGELVFSTDYPVYQFYGKVELVNTSSFSISIQSTYTPLVFVAPQTAGSTSETVTCRSYEETSGVWTIVASTSAQQTYTKANNSTGHYPGQGISANDLPVNVYIFVRPRSQDADTGYGMNVYDSSGNLNFTTKLKVLKISGYHDTTNTASSPFPSGSDYTFGNQTLTSGTIPTNWAALSPDVGYSNQTTVSTAYWNTNGNQGLWYRALGSGRGSSNTTVRFSACSYISITPPGVSGQYPGGAIFAGRRILFLNTDNYSTPSYNWQNGPPIPAGTNSYIPASPTANIFELSSPYINGPATTSIVLYTNPSYGTVTSSGSQLTYTPTGGTAQYDQFSYRLWNSAGPSKLYYFTVNPGNSSLVFTTGATLPAGSVGVAYSTSITVTGGTSPYSYGEGTYLDVTVYPFPPGLSIDGSGNITGTPTLAGTYTIKIVVADSTAPIGPLFNAKYFTITIS